MFFEWFALVLWCYAFVLIVLSDEPRQNQGRESVDRKLVKAPPTTTSNFIAGRPKAALLFWFFGDFRCGALLFMFILVTYKYKIGNKRLLNVRLAGDHLYGKLFCTWLSLVMSMMVSFCAVLFPTRCLGWDLEQN